MIEITVRNSTTHSIYEVNIVTLKKLPRGRRGQTTDPKIHKIVENVENIEFHLCFFGNHHRKSVQTCLVLVYEFMEQD